MVIDADIVEPYDVVQKAHGQPQTERGGHQHYTHVDKLVKGDRDVLSLSSIGKRVRGLPCLSFCVAMLADGPL